MHLHQLFCKVRIIINLGQTGTQERYLTFKDNHNKKEGNNTTKENVANLRCAKTIKRHAILSRAAVAVAFYLYSFRYVGGALVGLSSGGTKSARSA